MLIHIVDVILLSEHCISSFLRKSRLHDVYFTEWFLDVAVEGILEGNLAGHAGHGSWGTLVRFSPVVGIPTEISASC